MYYPNYSRNSCSSCDCDGVIARYVSCEEQCSREGCCSCRQGYSRQGYRRQEGCCKCASCGCCQQQDCD